MKKTYRTLSAIFTLALSLAATSCHENIYNIIETEVELEKNVIGGDIKGIVPANGYLYLANNNIYRKTAESSNVTNNFNKQWTKLTPDCQGHIISLAGNSVNLYAVTLSYIEDIDKGSMKAGEYTLYSSADGVSWTEIERGPKPMKVFDNQAQEIDADGKVMPASAREAFARIYDTASNSYKIYKLSGTSKSEQTGADKNSLHAACFNGTTVFSQHAITANSTHIYFSEGGTALFYATKADLSDKKSFDYQNTAIHSLALTADYILLGTKSGITRARLTAGVPASSVSKFETGNNAQAILSSQVPLIYVRNNGANEGQDDEYAALNIQSYLSNSSDSFKEIGLYAYYRNRGKWNCDGTEAND